MVLTGEGAEDQSCHTAWPTCEGGWALSAPLGSGWTMGPLPWASCLLPAQLSSASTLEPCGPDSYEGSLWSCPLERDCQLQGLANTAPWQGSWTDTPYAALAGGQGGKCPLPWLARPPPLLTPAFPFPSPTPGLGHGSFLSSGASDPRPARG